MRNSKQRHAILKVVKETTSHPDAVWIYEEVRKEIPNISLGTVYRNLKYLKEDGEILELLTGNQSKFDGNVTSHPHFKCEKCQQIYDVDFHLEPSVNIEITQKTGFKVTQNCLEFRGICKKCLGTSV